MCQLAVDPADQLVEHQGVGSLYVNLPGKEESLTFKQWPLLVYTFDQQCYATCLLPVYTTNKSAGSLFGHHLCERWQPNSQRLSMQSHLLQDHPH